MPSLLLMLALGGCAVEQIPVELEDEGEVELLPPGPPPPARPRIRMNLDQLDAALIRASGGVRWAANFRGHQWSQWSLIHLGRTLGKADYFQRTEDDLSPGAVFQKFLDDAARYTCGQMMARDQRLLAGEVVDDPRLAEPILLRHIDPEAEPGAQREAVEANLRHLLARFHTRLLAPGHPALGPWLELVDAVHAAGADGPTGWQAVCVALITHPDFYLY